MTGREEGYTTGLHWQQWKVAPSCFRVVVVRVEVAVVRWQFHTNEEKLYHRSPGDHPSSGPSVKPGPGITPCPPWGSLGRTETPGMSALPARAAAPLCHCGGETRTGQCKALSAPSGYGFRVSCACVCEVLRVFEALRVIGWLTWLWCCGVGLCCGGGWSWSDWSEPEQRSPPGYQRGRMLEDHAERRRRSNIVVVMILGYIQVN